MAEKDTLKKYQNFTGKGFFEEMSLASKNVGDNFFSGLMGMFHVASKKGNSLMPKNWVINWLPFQSIHVRPRRHWNIWLTALRRLGNREAGDWQLAAGNWQIFAGTEWPLK